MKKYLFLSVLLFFVSCSQGSESLFAPDRIVENKYNLPSDSIKGEAVFVDTKSAVIIDCIGPYLVSVSPRNNEIIGVFDLRDSCNATYFGSKGNAYNEFSSFPSDCYGEITSDSCLLWYCSDVGKNRVVSIDILESIREKKCVLRNTYTLRERSFLSSFYNSTSDKLVAGRKVISYDDPRDNIFYPPEFVLSDFFGEKSVRVFPRIVKNTDRDIVFLAYKDMIRISPDMKKLVQSMMTIDIINVLDIDNGDVLGIIQKDQYSLDFFEMSNDIGFYANESLFFSRDVALSNNNIYVLRDGRKIGFADIEDTFSFIPSLLILAYSGDVIGYYNLDKPIIKIVYSEFYDCLFGLDFEGYVYKYEIPR